MTILDIDAVYEAFCAIALQDAQMTENDFACEDGRDPVELPDTVATDYDAKYRAAIAKVCAMAEPLLAVQDLNTFPARCPDGDINSVFGSDLYLTSHGHGAGFWDGDWNPIGDELTEIARTHAPSGDLCEHVDGGWFLI